MCLLYHAPTITLSPGRRPDAVPAYPRLSWLVVAASADEDAAAVAGLPASSQEHWGGPVPVPSLAALKCLHLEGNCPAAWQAELAGGGQGWRVVKAPRVKHHQG